MACSASSMAVDSCPEEAYASATATPDENTSMLRDRRRHSFHAARKLSSDYQDADAVFIRVCTCIIGGKISPGNCVSNQSFRSNSSCPNWNVECNGLNNIGNPTWCRSTPV